LKKIEQHIYELLFQHDCVILPEFGGFVANYISASLDEDHKRIHPPSKQVIFNKHLKNNDGLLAHKIVELDGVSYDEALVSISNLVSEIRAGLAKTKRFEIAKVGVLYLDESKNVCFKPGNTNFLINSFGLPIVKAIPIEKQVVINEQVVKETKVKPIEIIHEKEKLHKANEESNVIPITAANSTSKRNNMWWVAAALIPIAFYSAWIPMKTDLLKGGDNFQYSDLNPFTYSKNIQKNYTKKEVEITSEDIEHILSDEEFKNSLGEDVYGKYSIDDSEAYLTVQLKEIDEIFVPETTFVEKENIAINAAINTSKGYFVIGGCFSKETNAINFVQELKSKGYEALIVDENDGLHRVAFGGYSSRKEAKAAKKAIKEAEGLSSWVLKK